MKQIELAKELGISKSYLSMILRGQRKPSPELIEKLQSTPRVHKVVNNHLWEVPSKQRVVGSSPARDAILLSSALPRQNRVVNGIRAAVRLMKLV